MKVKYHVTTSSSPSNDDAISTSSTKTVHISVGTRRRRILGSPALLHFLHAPSPSSHESQLQDASHATENVILFSMCSLSPLWLNPKPMNKLQKDCAMWVVKGFEGWDVRQWGFCPMSKRVLPSHNAFTSGPSTGNRQDVGNPTPGEKNTHKNHYRNLPKNVGLPCPSFPHLPPPPFP